MYQLTVKKYYVIFNFTEYCIITFCFRVFFRSNKFFCLLIVSTHPSHKPLLLTPLIILLLTTNNNATLLRHLQLFP